MPKTPALAPISPTDEVALPMGPLSGSNLLSPRSPASAGAHERPDASRRGFMRGVASAGAAAFGGLALSACGGGSDDPAAPAVQYRHGVASGDPLADRVILWTRLTTEATAAVQVLWQVALDESFATVVASGITTTDSTRDWTVKVDAAGLDAGARYVYRFDVGGQRSPVGRTKTLPTGSIGTVRMAVFSCSNFPAGFFNVYAEAAKLRDLDVTIHLGDYIYEYARDGYASAGAAALGRLSDPATEILSLSDYRRRYAQYRTDPDLQALHAAAPMIAVWDDHELTNDAWRDGAENHQPATEGSFTARRAVAVQAWHEWLPVRTGSDPLQIYRSFDFGNLLSLHMLDTRLIARDRQLDYASFSSPSGLDAARFTAAVGDPNRQLLGTAQTQWLQERMTRSTATWQVLGQQVLMGRMNIPAPILFEALNPGTGVSVAAYSAIATKAATAPATLTVQERAILAQPSIPYNLDAWDGYAAARETVFGLARTLNKNLVVLAGDTHNAWANDLLDLAGNRVGVEFATPSVSSPGFEAFFTDNPATLAASLTQLIGPLEYCDTSRRGFLLVTADATQCRADWVYVNTLTSRTYTAVSDRTLRMLPGASGRRLVAA
jgi:alkaline phosphatase D